MPASRQEAKQIGKQQVATQTETTCPYCGVGCGVLINQNATGQVNVEGNPRHPSNYGRLCSKGSALGETVELDGRLLQPEINGVSGDWQPAIAHVAEGFKNIIATHGPDAVAFYVSGQLLTEDYYVANKLMKGFIGSANIDTNSRLCMSSTVAGHKRAFGSDTVPCSYEDLEQARLIVLTGSNTAWCHPVLFQRIRQAKETNPGLKVVVIDPRKTNTCDIADLHLPLKPGSDAILFNGLLTYLQQTRQNNAEFINAFTRGSEAALQSALQTAPTINDVADLTDLDFESLMSFYSLFADTEQTVTVFSQGINQSSSGSDKVNAIINCHLLTGRIGRPGMGPFSFTGQPNAMGGREVGGLANQLAAHMDIENPQHRQQLQTFWNAPVMADKAGLKAVDLFQAIEQGKVKAVWIMGTNPVVSMPDADQVRRALNQCELVVVSDCIKETDTTACADVLFPALAWGEKSGTVTNSERRISRQRAFLPGPGAARADWWIISEVARKMGFSKAFTYTAAADIFREHAALSGYQNEGRRDFDISLLAGLSDEQYNHLQPVQWPITNKQPQGTARMFSDGQFYTDDGKARFIPITPRLPTTDTDTAYPLRLNTGRVRDQWHTMTRTGKSPRLSGHIPEPYAELHARDAARFAIEEGALIKVSTPLGNIIVRARISEQQQRGSVFVPMHWNSQFSSQARVDSLIPAVVDPLSGQPEFKHAVAAIEPYTPTWHGFLLSRRELSMDKSLENTSYWSRARGKGLWRYELAGEQMPEDWGKAARELLCSNEDDVGWVEYFDKAANRYRASRLVNNQLESCIFISPEFALPPRDWLASLFDSESLSDEVRASLLSARPPAGQKDIGRIVCACHGVGEQSLRDAIKNGSTTVQALGECTRAGTNCGSCIPELKGLLAEEGRIRPL